MAHVLWLIPALPLVGFLFLAIFGRRLGENAAAAVAVSAVTGAFAVAVAETAHIVSGNLTGVQQTLWTWIRIGDFAPRWEFSLDHLSVCFVLVITGVGALIHLYATDYMHGDESYSRFFAYMNLFVASMLTVVLADDLLVLYLGWEGVGLCSYLLIGFWYKDPANGRAARKAFVVTRVGDAAMAVALFILATHFGTLRIPDLLQQVPHTWVVGQQIATLTAFMLLGGAIGKSAQVPLQVWLPDAMAGPTPVSALIHAATMVTAGVYLIARTHPIFEIAPTAMHAVAIVGVVTLLIAGFAALAQRDIKRVLAYSTISQIGYMFLALGVGAWSAAIFHFVTHAFFKALLFLASGSVILAMHHEQDMFEMGGLRKKLPVTFWTFLAGSLALAGFPLISAGFYSKDAILAGAAETNLWLWVGGLLGVGLTGLYTFRMVFITFFGEAKHEPHRLPSPAAKTALITLAVLSIIGGGLMLPDYMGGFAPLGHFLEPVLPTHEAGHAPMSEPVMALIASLVALSGIGLAWWLFGTRPAFLERLQSGAFARGLDRFMLGGLGFDTLYDFVFIRPFVGLGKLNHRDVIDGVYEGTAALTEMGNHEVARTQNGKLRWYLAATAGGAALLLGLAIWG